MLNTDTGTPPQLEKNLLKQTRLINRGYGGIPPVKFPIRILLFSQKSVNTIWTKFSTLNIFDIAILWLPVITFIKTTQTKENV